jgi:hypothetical protein
VEVLVAHAVARRARAWALAAALPVPALLASDAAAQAPAAGGVAVASGTRVRVSPPGAGRQSGTLIALTGDTLVLRRANGDTATWARAGVTRLDLSRGRRGHPWRGAAIGFAVAAAVGAVAGAAAHEPPDPESPSCRDRGLCGASRGAEATEAALLLGTLGAVPGAVIGAMIRTERWQRTPLGAWHVGLTVPAARRGAGAGVALRF